MGGTLGLFIGFSFSGLISYVLNGILKIVDSVNEWLGSKKDQTKVTLVQEKSHEINKGTIVYYNGIYSISLINKSYTI